MTVYGVHAGLQQTSTDELRALWRRIEDLGFGWISIWDHFYSATAGDGAESLEAVATHAALACDTRRVRCGSLVYSVGYRHPAVLANAICTIDQLSAGRAELGLGAGWSQVEYDAYGIAFPPVGVRMDQLEEAIQCVRGLLRDEVTDFEGRWFQLRDARCEPRPVQAELPIWVGGQGERRTLRIAARWADGWNAPFVAPETFAHKRWRIASRG
jgi:alkanesulfonate monooxygenase SsuD/methylene tetrahydromethanopterin reductase-like flavin-dependent oxidoreductase (luciferase family)